jgi:hypothetical protein
VRIWALFDAAYIMSFKEEVHLSEMMPAAASN